MILIQKGREPDSLVHYRNQPYATYDDFEHKDHIREALLRDQGHICAYCMRRIHNDSQTMKIEHWLPQSRLTSEAQKLDFRIMLGVCDGCKGSPDKLTHCDEHRHNANLTIDPQQPHMMETIGYYRDGTVYSTNPALDNDLNHQLNLNCSESPSKLMLGRKNVYQEIYGRLRKLQANNEWKYSKVKAIFDSYEGHTGVHKEYVGVARFLAKKYLAKFPK